MEEQQVSQEQQQNVEQQQPQVELPNPFLDTSWSDAKNFNAGENVPQAPQPTNEEEEEILEPNEWLKREFNWESTEAAKAELEELRQLREKASSDAEVEFANEQSAKFFNLLREGKEDDVYNFLQNKKRLERLATSEIDKNTAADIIKFNMQQKYKDLTQEEIDYKFKKQFSVPSKPVQTDFETDEEYQERITDWESRVKDVETEMFIEAKLARPELEKYKNELVLPEVEFQNNQKQLSQEELDLHKKILDEYYDSAQKALDAFDGLSVTVKDEEVEIPLSYNLSDDERVFIAQKMERFAENNLDANAILADRWLTKDGAVDTARMIKDLALIYSEGKVGQKFANDAAAKRLSEYIKRSSNVTVSSRTAQNTFGNDNGKSDLDRQIEFIWRNG